MEPRVKLLAGAINFVVCVGRMWLTLVVAGV